MAHCRTSMSSARRSTAREVRRCTRRTPAAYGDPRRANRGFVVSCLDKRCEAWKTHASGQRCSRSNQVGAAEERLPGCDTLFGVARVQLFLTEKLRERAL